MNLDNVTVELRPRSEWEAADLGARMVRRDARTIYATWFAITLPLVSLTIIAILFTPYASYAGILYWWLEPMTDGPILHVISRRLFGEQTGFRATMRELGRITWRNKIFLLPPYRFHFARSIAIPVTQLEELSGSARRTRAKVLNTRIMNFGTGITVAYQHLFLALYFGVLLIVYALVPTSAQDTLGSDWMSLIFDESKRSTYVIQLLLFYIAQSALHPWFVGGGFGLYINCRTRLEAWDIEVAFRRMVLRRAKGVASMASLLMIVSLALVPDIAIAQDDVNIDEGFSGFWEETEVTEAMSKVLDSDAMSTSEETTVWRAIEKPVEESDTEVPEFDFGVFENITLLMSFVVEIWLWLAAAALIFLLYMTRDIWLPFLEDLRTAPEKPRRVILSGGEITADTLPTDIPAEVRKLWTENKKRKALSLLFRGSVFYAVTQHGVRLPQSATEGACVDAVNNGSNQDLSAYFEKVAMAWVLIAYGFREPGEDAVMQLCTDWPRHYGESR